MTIGEVFSIDLFFFFFFFYRETLLESHYGLNSIDPVNRRTSMSVSDMSSMGQQQQRLCNVCCRRDVSHHKSLDRSPYSS